MTDLGSNLGAKTAQKPIPEGSQTTLQSKRPNMLKIAPLPNEMLMFSPSRGPQTAPERSKISFGEGLRPRTAREPQNGAKTGPKGIPRGPPRGSKFKPRRLQTGPRRSRTGQDSPGRPQDPLGGPRDRPRGPGSPQGGGVPPLMPRGPVGIYM